MQATNKPPTSENLGIQCLQSFLFTENRKKSYKQDELPISTFDDVEEAKKQSYIASLQTKKNPDLIVPNCNWLKGNMYFKKTFVDNIEEVSTMMISKEDGEKSESDQLMEGDDSEENEYEKMRNQQARYFMEDNPTIKCKNCLQYGHRSSDCPNETKRLNCILCSKDTHDSFSCTEKHCFKCNKIGHVANQCKEKIVTKCPKCGLVGHLKERCLKVYDRLRDIDEVYRCMECGKGGHLKCTRQKQSYQIPLDCSIKQDLNEFPKDITFDYVQVQYERDNMKDQQQKPFLTPLNHQGNDQYCCYCGEKHGENYCQYQMSKRGNKKFLQFEKVRQKLNNEVLGHREGNLNTSCSREERGQYGHHNQQYHQQNYHHRSYHHHSHNGGSSGYRDQHRENYVVRISNDPRRV